MNGDLLLVILIIIGLIGRSPIITTAACILLAIKLIGLDRYFPTMERRGLELGLLFLDDWGPGPLCQRAHLYERYPIGIYHLAGYHRTTWRSYCYLYEWKRVGTAKNRPTINCGSCDWFYIWHYIYARHSGWPLNGSRNNGFFIKASLFYFG